MESCTFFLVHLCLKLPLVTVTPLQYRTQDFALVDSSFCLPSSPSFPYSLPFLQRPSSFCPIPSLLVLPLNPFYRRDAMLARSLRQQRVCLSVCPSVRHTPVLCLAERKQDREMYTV